MHSDAQMIRRAEVYVDGATGTLTPGDAADAILHSQTTLGSLANVFADAQAYAALRADTVVYRVQMHKKEADGTAGGLMFGTSFVHSGRVGDEYFMTRGHIHANKQRAEYYWCIQGQGVLLMMDEAGACTAEKMEPGSLHYIAGGVAHRIANTADGVLAVGACWPADAGHDYDFVRERGIPVRIKCVNGAPALVRQEEKG
ncbi:MAG: glucose-6-phosphate isomerase family protein [Eubacteriales bacterium]|nr:glucose-6-phosphate isomerase family protein [Eubacteriales bacterium]